LFVEVQTGADMKQLARAGAAILAVASFVVSAWATTTISKERVCPVGGEKYESFEIASTSFRGIRLDLQRTGVGAYLPYVECPNGFIVFKDEDQFAADEIAKLTPVVAGVEYQVARRDEPPATRVVLLLRALGQTDVEMRHWLFRAAFESESKGKELEPLRLKYLALAADAYGVYVKGHEIRDEAWWGAQVRRADLLRQLSRFDEAAALVAEMEKAHASENEFYLKVAAQILERAKVGDAQPADYKDDGD
jgi:hypothetical protein